MDQLQERITELVERTSNLVGAHGEAFEEIDAIDNPFSPQLTLGRGGIILFHEDRFKDTRATGSEPEARVYDPSVVSVRYSFMEEYLPRYLSQQAGSYVLRLSDDNWTGLFVPIGSVSHNAHDRITTYYLKDAPVLTDEDLDVVHGLLDRYEESRSRRIKGVPVPAPVI